MTDRTGQCMCGAVRFTARDVTPKAGICHCEMCRRWTGSALIGVTVAKSALTWDGAEHIAEIQSSPWAKRAWCSKCGSGLYYEVTAEGPYAGDQELPLGIFDDPNGFQITNEIYFDHKPDSYAFAGSEDRELLTRQDCIEKFAVPNGA